MGYTSMKRDYSGKAVPNISNGSFYNVGVSNILSLSNPLQTFAVSISASPTSNYNLKLPPGQGASGQVMVNDGAGNLTWGAGGGGGGGTGTVTTVVGPSYLGITGSGTSTITFTPVTTGTAGSMVLSNAPTLTGTTNFGKLNSTGQSNAIINISGTDPAYVMISTALSKGFTLGIPNSNNGYMTGSTAGDVVLISSPTSNIWMTTASGGPAFGIINTTQNTIVYYNLILGPSTGKGTINIINNTTTGNTYNFQLPATAGTTGDLLTSAGGSSAMTWTGTTGTGNIVRSNGPTINDINLRGTDVDIQVSGSTSIVGFDLVAIVTDITFTTAAFTVTGPVATAMAVNFITLGGAFAVTTAAGSVDFTTAAGNISFTCSATGVITLETTTGAIALTTGGGAIGLTTAGGAINMGTVGGAIGIDTAGGFITALVGAGQILLDCIGGAVNLSTTVGQINLTATSGSINLGVGVGSINIGSTVGGNVNINSGTGAFNVNCAQGGTNLVGGQFTVTTTNGFSGSATGNITMTTNRAGAFTGPGNVTIDTSAAFTGTVTINAKGTLGMSSSANTSMQSKQFSLSVDNGSANTGNVSITTTAVGGGNTGPGNITINATSAFTGNITISAKTTLSLVGPTVGISSSTLSFDASTSTTFTTPVVTINALSAVSSAPFEVLNAAQGTGTFTRIYFGREKTTSNCGSLAFFYNGAGSGNNYVAFGQFGAERLLVYPGTNIGTIPTQGSVLANQIRSQFSEVSFHITLYDSTATVGEKIRILANQPTVNYDFILPRTPGTAGQLLTSGGGTGPMTWSSAGAGTVNTVVAPTYFGVTGSGTATITFTPVVTGTAGSIVLSVAPTLTGNATFDQLTSTINSSTLANINLTNTNTSNGTTAKLVGKGTIVDISGVDPLLSVYSPAKQKSIVLCIPDTDNGYMTGATAGDAIIRTYNISGGANQNIFFTNTTSGYSMYVDSGNRINFFETATVRGGTDTKLVVTSDTIKNAVLGVATSANSFFTGTAIGDAALRSSNNLYIGSANNTTYSTYILNRLGVNERATISGGTDTRLAVTAGGDEVLTGVATGANSFFTGTAVGDAAIRSSKNLYIGSLNNSTYKTYILNPLVTTPAYARYEVDEITVCLPGITEYVTNLVVVQSSGENLTITGTQDRQLQNNLGRPVAVTVSYSIRVDSGLPGFYECYFRVGTGSTRYGYSTVQIGDYATGTSTVYLPNGEYFSVYFYNGSTADGLNNFFNLNYIIH